MVLTLSWRRPLSYRNQSIDLITVSVMKELNRLWTGNTLNVIPILFNSFLLTIFKNTVSRSSPPALFLEKGALKKCKKFTGQHPCQSEISIKLLCNFIEIILWQGCSPVHLLRISRKTFCKNNYGALLLCQY